MSHRLRHQIDSISQKALPKVIQCNPNKSTESNKDDNKTTRPKAKQTHQTSSQMCVTTPKYTKRTEVHHSDAGYQMHAMFKKPEAAL